MAQRKTIIWHIGFRKTASSTMQYMLANFENPKPQELYISPRDGLTRNWRNSVTLRLRAKHKKGSDKLSKAMQSVVETVRDLPQPTVLISDENLFAHAVFLPDGTHMFHWAADILAEIETEFAEFDNVFVGYTRPMEAWLKSAYSQEVKRGRTSKLFETWIKDLPQDFTWEQGLDRIRKAISSPLHLLNIEDDTAAGYPAGGQLLELAGIDKQLIANLPPTPRLNESLTNAQMNKMRLLNRIKLGGYYRRHIVRNAKKQAIKQAGTA